MILIVGLGNPGEKYKNTRHNVGFMVVDRLVSSIKYHVLSIKIKWETNQRFNSMICKLNNNLIGIKPQAFMNLSGEAVAKVTNFYKISTENIIVIHDDVDLELGRLKIQKGGGTAGHHGLESVVKSLKTSDFTRFRVGIGRPEEKSGVRSQESELEPEITAFVLQKFSAEEWLIMEKTVRRTVEAVEYYLENGIEKTMNQFNS